MRKNSDYRRLLRRASALSTLAGDNRFKVSAYDRAARIVEQRDTPIDPLIRAGTVRELDGIGDSIAALLEACAGQGEAALTALFEPRVPSSVVAMLDVQGLGPKKVRQLWNDEGIDSLEALEDAAKSGRLGQVSGFGAKTQTRVLTELARLARTRGMLPFARATRAVEAVAATLGDSAEALGAKVLTGGALSRAEEWVDAIELTVATAAAEAVQSAAHQAFGTPAFVDGVPLRITCTPPVSAGLAEVVATATEDHREALERRAQQHGLSLAAPDAWAEAARTPDAVYARLGLTPLPAPQRTGAALAALEEGWLPPAVHRGDLRGDLHMHTTWSDGAVDIAGMAEAAAARGLEYIAITDHSQALTIANGLDRGRLVAQMDAIDAYNANAPACRVLRGLEVDILDDGALDMDADVLERLDWVVGSVHSAFSQSSAAMTRRLLRAIDSGLIRAIGHPTGRKLGVRDGYAFDIAAVFDACESAGVALELNASPHRLDLGESLLREAMERPGLWLTLNTDAHSRSELDNARYGILVAQRAWIPGERILNTLDADSLLREL